MLEAIYEKFNIDHPEDYRGIPCLSVILWSCIRMGKIVPILWIPLDLPDFLILCRLWRE